MLGLRVIDGLASGAARAPWSVAALVREVGELLVDRFSVCAVRGELSGFSRAASGHCYFNLKDADGGSAMLRCAMFRRAASLLDFAPRDGQLVELRGRLGVYEPRGELQLVVEAMRAAGAGALYEQFLRLRARLEAAGLFDAGRKRALPRFARTLGVVTSLAGAALHDVLTALARRAPQVRVVVYPSPVQGADAPAALAAAIGLASARAEVEVLIVCRGGGSLEDLWAFNDEQVVRAIVGAAMPVVCGVGHETDVTLADLAADLRAPTPTAAAELAAPTRAGCLDELAALQQALQRRVRTVLDRHAQQLDRSAARLTRPDQALRRGRERLMLLGHRLRGHAPHALALQRSRLQRVAAESRLGARAHLTHQRDRLDALAARLRALGPEQVLARGYAWLGDATGRPVSSVRRLAIGAPLRAVLRDGTADVVVTGVQGRTAP
ncbi:MAG TPA: exodeoxyribonuclease VII large subunit [Burkholderiaceae bacterium]|nr:exodeoxyribonuclease VII large subunit [Burkholderiaceae bacterium]